MLFAPWMAQNPKQILRRGKLAANGRLPTTLRLAIRANPSTRGFAARRNVAEAERANASVAKPEGRARLDNFVLAQI
jgi:hypothetical protein